jgi:hypothetical protein
MGIRHIVIDGSGGFDIWLGVLCFILSGYESWSGRSWRCLRFAVAKHVHGNGMEGSGCNIARQGIDTSIGCNSEATATGRNILFDSTSFVISAYVIVRTDYGRSRAWIRGQ